MSRTDLELYLVNKYIIGCSFDNQIDIVNENRHEILALSHIFVRHFIEKLAIAELSKSVTIYLNRYAVR